MVSVEDIRRDRVLEQLAVHVRVPACGVCARTETDAAEGVVLESARPDRYVRLCLCVFVCLVVALWWPHRPNSSMKKSTLTTCKNEQTHTQTHKQTNTCAAGGSNRKPTRLRHLARALRAEGGRSPWLPTGRAAAAEPLLVRPCGLVMVMALGFALRTSLGSSVGFCSFVKSCGIGRCRRQRPLGEASYEDG